jgi:hypothetical protein
MIPRFRFAPHGREGLHELERLLHQAYGEPEDRLGNQLDPLDEAIYIILSFQTDLRRFKETWQKLRSAFPRWSDVEAAPHNEVTAVLQPGGLHRQKARVIKQLLAAVRRRFGDLSLDALHEMADIKAAPASSIAIAWVVALLVSSLGDIVWFELAGAVPLWLLWAKVSLLGALILLSWLWQPIKALRPFLNGLKGMRTRSPIWMPA